MNPRAQGELPGAAQNLPRDVPSGVADIYVWKAPGCCAEVHIPLRVVDRLSAEIMRGYGANPKRNAEIGGVLIGSVEPGSPAMIRVADFEMVPCQYRRGPSYVFTEDDCEPFEKAGARPGAIGYFRSHTREGLSLAAEDIELLDYFFPGAYTAALLVRPYATTASVAGFFIRENGTFPEATPLEFPFRRQALSGLGPPSRRSMMERRPRRSASSQDENQAVNPDVNPAVNQKILDRDMDQPPAIASQLADLASPPTPAAEGPASQSRPRTIEKKPQPSKNNLPSPERHQQAPNGSRQPLDGYSRAEPAYFVPTPARSRMSSGWVWIPLSFVFLLLGIGLGYEVALLSVGSRLSNPASEFTLSLVVSKTGQNLSVHWDGQAPAVRASRRGILEISEKGVTKPVDLDAAQLQNGTLTYRNATNDVHFKLIVFPRDQMSITESAEWRQ